MFEKLRYLTQTSSYTFTGANFFGAKITGANFFQKTLKLSLQVHKIFDIFKIMIG